jgi:hypothetical protein
MVYALEQHNSVWVKGREVGELSVSTQTLE